MNVLSVCSGIGAPEAAWTPLGWNFVACSEIEPFPSAVLTHHYPDVPNWGDMTKFKEWPDADINVLVGGTPCQSFSVAGLRKGLDDPRGNLALTYLAIADRYRPRWMVWENVPGVLSSNGGRDFGAFLGALGELGYGWSYRVLDAQYFGLAQRRKRVFVVGYLGDWRRAAAVLFEPESLSGHPPPSREAGEEVAAPTAPSFTASGHGVERAGESRGQDPVVAMCLNAHGGSGRINAKCETLVTHTLRGDGCDASEDGTGRGTPIIPIDLRQASRGEKITNNRAEGGSGGAPGHGVGNPGDPAFTVSERGQAVFTLQAGAQHAVAFQTRGSNLDVGEISGTIGTNADRASGSAPMVAFSCKDDGGDAADIAPTLRAIQAHPQSETSSRQTGIRIDSAVRRLMPVECEFLQGFPRGYTAITYRGKPAADGNRYKALGNSMAVPVVRWIGERIDKVDSLDLIAEAADD